MTPTKLHQHKDEDHDGKCDDCDVAMCGEQKQEGASNLICSRIQHNDKQPHYDRHQKRHF